MTTDKIIRCKNCAFFSSEGVAHCRRNPPRPSEDGQRASFPLVNADEWWCGNFTIPKYWWNLEEEGGDPRTSHVDPTEGPTQLELQLGKMD